MLESEFLSDKEIEFITGTKHIPKQIEWMDENNFKYLLTRGNKKLIVHRSSLKEKLDN